MVFLDGTGLLVLQSGGLLFRVFQRCFDGWMCWLGFFNCFQGKPIESRMVMEEKSLISTFVGAVDSSHPDSSEL